MIALDTSVVANGNGVNSLAFPALTTVKQNEILIAGFHFSNTTPTAVTFDKLTWTLLTTKLTIPTAGGEIFVYWARAIQPLASSIITATYTTGGNPQSSQIITTFSGVNMANPIGAINSATSAATTNISAAVTTTKINSLVIGFVGQTANIALSPGTNQLEANQTTSAGGFSRAESTYQNATTSASGTSVTQNSTSSSAAQGIYAIELLDGSRPSFQPNKLRPRIFAPGLAR